jgi:hydroxymethylpyrimidine/phosphomethylpyrimidine kinase
VGFPGARRRGDGARGARLVERLGARAALVKGGHLAGDETVDVLFDGEVTRFAHPRIATSSTHGTGCTLSAAVAAGGSRWGRAAAGAGVTAPRLRAPGDRDRARSGRGHGPLNHWG